MLKKKTAQAQSCVETRQMQGTDKQGMREKRHITITAAKIALTFLLVILVLGASFFLTFSDNKFMESNLEKSKSYERLGKEDATAAHFAVMYFLKGRATPEATSAGLEKLGFERLEISHLADVKARIDLLKYLSIAALVAAFALIVYLMRTKQPAVISKALFYGGISALALLLVIAVLGLNFDFLFSSFHSIIFPKGNYTFPYESLLIRLYPEDFFMRTGTRILMHATVISILLIYSGALPLRAERRRLKKA